MIKTVAWSWSSLLFDEIHVTCDERCNTAAVVKLVSSRRRRVDFAGNRVIFASIVIPSTDSECSVGVKRVEPLVTDVRHFLEVCWERNSFTVAKCSRAYTSSYRHHVNLIRFYITLHRFHGHTYNLFRQEDIVYIATATLKQNTMLWNIYTIRRSLKIY